MSFFEELFFEITLEGPKAELRKFVTFVRSGALEDFLEGAEDYLCFDDDYAEATDEANATLTFTNDDLGVEIDEFDPEEFLKVFCHGARSLDVYGRFYDVDEEELSFRSPVGDAGFVDGASTRFNDELDEQATLDDAEDEEL